MMKKRIDKTRVVAASLLLMATTSFANAATTTSTFGNEYTASHIFLFANGPSGGPPPLEFLDLTIRNGFSGWSLSEFTPTLAIFEGPAVAPNSNHFRLTYSHSEPTVSFQWAEVLFQAGTQVTAGSGDLTFTARGRGGRWSETAGVALSATNGAFIDNYFDSMPAAAVPLPNSIGLMLSAVAFAGFSRRRGRNAADAISRAS